MLLVGAGVVSLVLLELLCRLLFSAPLPWLMPQHRFEASPTVGFRYQPSQSTYTADKPFRTNRFGFRGPEWSVEKSAGTRRIVVLGDSIGMGYGVREEDAFPALIERRAGPGVEVLNLSVAAYSTEQEVRSFLSDGLQFAPDQVVIELYWNDVSAKSDVAVTADGALIDGRSGDQRSSAEGPTAYWLRNLLKRSRALYVLSFKLRQVQALFSSPDTHTVLQRAVLLGEPDAVLEQGWAEIERQLAQLKVACVERGIPLLVVIPPMPQQLTGGFPGARYQSVVGGICERQGLRCLNLLDAFQRNYRGHESLFVAYDGDHPNEAGHALIADAVLAALATAR